jgi:hypothetical protein
MNKPPNKKGSTGLVTISAVVTAAMRDGLKDWGAGNLSEGLRLAISEPHQSPSGAAWITNPVQLPDPTSCEGPEVLAMPHGLMAHGIAATTFLIDMEAGELSFLAPGGGVSVEFTLADLALIAGRLPTVVIACCDNSLNPDEFGHSIGGVHVTRLRHGLIEIRPGGLSGGDSCAVALPIRQALQLVAEVLALLARRVEHHQLAVKELNGALAGSAVGQEAA